VVNANMIRGISTNTVEKGLDVRDFSLLPYGGAGPLHAVDLARELAMKRVIVPPYPGVFSALGLLVANTRYDYVTTVAVNQDTVSAADLESRFAQMEARGKAQLLAQHVSEANIRLIRSADLRYEGQSYELNTPVPSNDSLTATTVSQLIDTFHKLHYQVYAYGAVDEKVEFINLRVTAIGLAPEVKLGAGQRDLTGTLRENLPGLADKAAKNRRPVYFFEHGFVETLILDRAKLLPGATFAGPCLVEEIASTTVVPPGARGWVDEYGSLIIEWR
jgi:N-methylhydantoinase A